MKNELYKKHLTTEDSRGCEFGYTVYSTKTNNWNSKRMQFEVEKTYIDDIFGMKCKTLDELKMKMGEK